MIDLKYTNQCIDSSEINSLCFVLCTDESNTVPPKKTTDDDDDDSLSATAIGLIIAGACLAVSMTIVCCCKCHEGYKQTKKPDAENQVWYAYHINVNVEAFASELLENTEDMLYGDC